MYTPFAIGDWSIYQGKIWLPIWKKRPNRNELSIDFSENLGVQLVCTLSFRLKITFVNFKFSIKIQKKKKNPIWKNGRETINYHCKCFTLSDFRWTRWEEFIFFHAYVNFVRRCCHIICIYVSRFHINILSAYCLCVLKLHCNLNVA